jgi:hypothetical protein
VHEVFALTDDDLLPQEACRFQHWGERDGPPFSEVRPLTDAAAAWLRTLPVDPSPRVLLCYQPKVVVSVPWATVCEHWLVFFWTAACVCDGTCDWVLFHDGDVFRFIPSAQTARATVIA